MVCMVWYAWYAWYAAGLSLNSLNRQRALLRRMPIGQRNAR